MPEQNNAINSLAHTKWNCKYHIVFAPKYRRKVFFAEKKGSNQRNTKDAMSVERRRNHRRRSMSRSHPFTSKYPTKNECIRVYGVSKGKK